MGSFSQQNKSARHKLLDRTREKRKLEWFELTHLVEGVGLSVSTKMVPKPLSEWKQHDLDGKADGRLRHCCG